jgi:iron complex transport system ATP-binding protein
MTAPGLTLDGLCYAYDPRAGDVLRNVSGSAPPGTIVGILGPNGSGKSTLLRLVAGILPPRSGDIRLDGQNMAALDPRARARTFAFVPQQTVLEFDYSVRDVVAMGRAPHQNWFGHETINDREAIDRALSDCRLEALRERAFLSLSGGERQLVTIARALTQQTPWLLLDEPTAHLDLKHRESLFQLLEALHRKRDLGALFVTHEPDHAQRLCSHVWMLKEGRVAFEGPVEQMRAEVPRVFDLEPNPG